MSNQTTSFHWSKIQRGILRPAGSSQAIGKAAIEKGAEWDCLGFLADKNTIKAVFLLCQKRWHDVSVSIPLERAWRANAVKVVCH